MGAAGMRQVQVGIEALSSRLLKKLNKGTTAMDNLEVMKHCEFRERPDLVGNLITEFPSSDERDVAETLKTIDFALPFNPLKDIPFWLGYGSAVWASPRAYGIRRVGNHPLYRYLFPREIRRRLTLMIQGYQGGVGLQRRLWSPVRRRMAEWRRAYAELHRNPGFDPILSYSDGGDFMIIRQWRHDRHAMTHRLVGTSRKIYLFCDTQRDVRDILLRFPGFGEEKVVPFLTMMVDKHLMFNEGDRYLSLAVPGPQEDHSF
jgi:hypothetical protein